MWRACRSTGSRGMELTSTLLAVLLGGSRERTDVRDPRRRFRQEGRRRRGPAHRRERHHRARRLGGREAAEDAPIGQEEGRRTGRILKTFEVEGSRSGSRSHDLVYPEVPRILALHRAEVIVFSPAKIGAPGIAPWELYVKARALENRVFVVSSNYLDPPRYPGAGPIVGFSESKGGGAIVYPELVGKGGGRQKAVVADLDLDRRDHTGQRGSDRGGPDGPPTCSCPEHRPAGRTGNERGTAAGIIVRC